MAVMFALVLAGCTSSSSSEESYGAPTGSTAADGTTIVELSGLSFTIPKGFDVVTARAGVIATNTSNEQVKVYVSATDGSLTRMYEGEYPRDWLKKLVDTYGTSTAKTVGKTSYGDVDYQDINGIDFAVKSGVAEKDGTTSHVVVYGGYSDQKEIVVITVTAAESDMALDVAKSMK